MFIFFRVQNLSLRHCGITDKGAIMIGRCLGSTKRSNVKLISLNLANNKITDAGLEEIAQVKNQNFSLPSELQIRSTEDNSKIIFLISQGKYPH